jgi:hypothetical protein
LRGFHSILLPVYSFVQLRADQDTETVLNIARPSLSRNAHLNHLLIMRISTSLWPALAARSALSLTVDTTSSGICRPNLPLNVCMLTAHSVNKRCS